jgi:murein hydrolase activator
MIRLVLAVIFFATSAAGEPARDAKAASEQLLEAAEALSRAQARRDRVAALTGVVQAYEAGLASLRAAVLAARTREAAIRTELGARDDQLSRILAVLASLEAAPETFLLLHPSGPLDTARAGMVAADVAPALQAEVGELRAILGELAELTAIREGAAETLGQGLAGIERARMALTRAISDRTELPRRVATDDATMMALIDAAETLDAFAANLAVTGASDQAAGFAEARGTLPLPVAGRVLRRAGEPDAAGVERPGWLVATPPRALVTAPRAGTVRYAGPLLDYENVIILEPENGYLLVFTGLGTLLAERGEIVGTGAALGLMPGLAPEPGDILAEIREGGGQVASETLYIEVREAETPVDPADWFRSGPDE